MAPRLVLIVGPTAVGKTSIAMSLYDELGGASAAQIISVDSAMIYRDMDIGSAKPSKAELERYPHALVDIRDPNEAYSVADFVRDADEVVLNAMAQGKHAILVGGTMLYAKKFVEGIADLPEADEATRAQLQTEYEQQGGERLYAELQSVDPLAAEEIHPNNPQRLLRALEVVRMSGSPMSDLWEKHKGADVRERIGQQPLIYGLFPGDRNKLHAVISDRFDEMVKEGFLDEVLRLQARGDLELDMPAMRAVGYRQAWMHLKGDIDANQFLADAKTATRRLAKRQMTWMRQWQGLKQIEVDDPERIVGQMVKDIVGE